MKYGKIRIEDGYLVFTRHMMLNSLPCKDIVWAYLRREGAEDSDIKQVSVNYLVIITRRKKRYKFDMTEREVHECIKLLRALNPDMATGFPKGSRIVLQSLPNTRDLGAIITRDGRHILPRRLLRSGELYHISRFDKEVLEESYNLKKVIDLRSDLERRKKPDMIMAGVEYYHIPVMDEAVPGFALPEDIKSLLKRLPDDPEKYIKKKYEEACKDQFVVKQYARFIDVIYRNEAGAVLWHCGSGKDRTGLGTALLLLLLGAEEETIMQDYMRTNEYLAGELQYMQRLAQTREDIPRGADRKLAALYQVKEEYLETAFMTIKKEYGTQERFFRNGLYLKPKMISELKDKYLI